MPERFVHMRAPAARRGAPTGAGARGGRRVLAGRAGHVPGQLHRRAGPAGAPGGVLPGPARAGRLPGQRRARVLPAPLEAGRVRLAALPGAALFWLALPRPHSRPPRAPLKLPRPPSRAGPAGLLGRALLRPRARPGPPPRHTHARAGAHHAACRPMRRRAAAGVASAVRAAAPGVRAGDRRRAGGGPGRAGAAGGRAGGRAGQRAGPAAGRARRAAPGAAQARARAPRAPGGAGGACTRLRRRALP